MSKYVNNGNDMSAVLRIKRTMNHLNFCLKCVVAKRCSRTLPEAEHIDRIDIACFGESMEIWSENRSPAAKAMY